MKNAIRSCRKVFCTAPLLLALLAGCVGRNAFVFPWSQTPESRLEHVTAATFDERVLKCEQTVLVDFYAEWCGPCKQLGPVLEEFAKDHPEIRVVKVNVDDNSDLAARYEVTRMPSLLVFRGGKVTSRNVGVFTKEYLAELTAPPGGAVAERSSTGLQR
jgi:thioredoxin 1